MASGSTTTSRDGGLHSWGDTWGTRGGAVEEWSVGGRRPRVGEGSAGDPRPDHRFARPQQTSRLERHPFGRSTSESQASGSDSRVRPIARWIGGLSMTAMPSTALDECRRRCAQRRFSDTALDVPRIDDIFDSLGSGNHHREVQISSAQRGGARRPSRPRRDASVVWSGSVALFPSVLSRADLSRADIGDRTS